MRKFEKISYDQFKKDFEDSKELYDKITLPVRSTKHSAAYDIKSMEEKTLHPGDSLAFKTGLKVCMNPDEVLYIFSRSSMGYKYDVSLTNCVGVIDSDYRGEIKAPLINQGKESFTIEKGMRIAQLIVHPIKLPAIKEVDEIRKTERNDKGFGSTGLK